MAREAAPDYRVIGGWSAGILFEHYTLGRSYTGRWLDRRAVVPGQSRAGAQTEERRQWLADLEAGRQIWLLDPAPELETELRAAGYSLVPVAGFVRAERAPR